MKRNQYLFIYSSRIGYIFIVTGLLYWAFSHHVYDDPFITYRYAENLRNGLGFVYNPGSRILSTTTPLFTLLLALLSKIWPDHLPQLATLVGAVSVAVSGCLLWDLGQTFKAPYVAWCGLLLYPTFPLLLSTLGSETPLFLAFAIGVFVAYARQRYGWAVLWVALAVLTRSDGVLVAAFLGGHYLWQNRAQLRERTFWREQPWFYLGIAFGMLLAWHIFAWSYFDAPLPVTLASKQAQGRMDISQQFAPGLLRVAGWYANRWNYLLELFLVVSGIGLAILKRKSWLLLIVWTGLYFLAYTLLGVTRYFWYYAPLVPGWVVAVGLGITLIVELPLQKWLPSIKNKFQRGTAIILLSAVFLGQLIHVNQFRQIVDQRYVIYRAVGEWLDENIPADSSVGALEVGIIGFYAHRPMVDFAGLIQPEVANQMEAQTTYDDTAVWAATTYQPEYLVLISGAHPRLEQEIVAAFCQTVQSFSGSQYGFVSDMVIYVCQYD